MLGKTSVSMMVLLVAASVIGISSSMHQYVEGQTPPPAATPKPQQAPKAESVVEATGRVLFVTIFASKTCSAVVQLPSDEPNKLGLTPGTIISLGAPIESFCTLFGLSKIGKTQITFDAQKISEQRFYRATRVSL
jgi:hypothetical protein